MKRFILTSFAVCILMPSFSQTRAIEVEYLKQEFEKENISLDEYKSLSKEFLDVLESIGGYPDLPYDASRGSIVFNYVKAYEYDKAIIFSRIKQWAAVSFGSLETVLHYEDLENGKLILKGYFNVNYLKDVKFWFSEKETIYSAKCYQTYMFTINDKRLKINVMGLNYEFDYMGYYEATSYNRTYKQDLDLLYPITKNKPETWKSNLSVLKNTDKSINFLVLSLDSYIRGYTSDYDF
ncbi:MAG: DUF4468 domain-containing protein [Cyclobacteriaceae bacterium]|nr:DUF4468 domain-containing protein [Cyclobacteriaceae bacterium]